jgi:RNA polymerase sigma factor (sigma-70 family)
MYSSTTASNLPGFFISPILPNIFNGFGLTLWHKAHSVSQLKQLSDDQCLKLLAKGDEPPLQELFDRYSELVFGYCLKLLKDRERAEDASQEVWVKVIRHATKYKSQGKFRAWILQIARNTCFSIFRELKKKFHEDISENEVEDVDQQSILHLISAQQDKDLIRSCLNKLPDNQRVAIIVWMSEDKSYEEIAHDMQTSVSAVKSLLFRAKQTLKEMLS